MAASTYGEQKSAYVCTEWNSRLFEVDKGTAEITLVLVEYDEYGRARRAYPIGYLQNTDIVSCKDSCVCASGTNINEILIDYSSNSQG